MYADDCILYCSGNTWDRVHRILQHDLDNIGIWISANALKFNVKKSKCLIIANSRKRRNLDRGLKLRITNQTLEFVDKFNYLGYYLD